MKKIRMILITLLLITILVTSTVCGTAAKTTGSNIELKGVWVATVFNLDYPDSQTTSVSALKKQADKILDNAAAMGMNAIFLQVRPCADSFYKSDIFPWSKYLTGTQGKAPADGFDPLAYWVEQAHARNLQLHAWINPYRITKMTEADYSGLASNNPAIQYPDYVIKHTDGNYYFNPALWQVRELVIQGAEEIVKKYGVDGIHLDDYFYPGPDFPDEASFAELGKGFSNVGDWRRNNVNLLVKEMDQRLHALDSDISFGISPFGIWNNKKSNSNGSDTSGSESYSKQYADTRKWVKEGWLDYIAPQIYWNIGYSVADYQVLLKWWTNVTAGTDVKLYIGMADYRSAEAEPGSLWVGTDEISRQMALNRSTSGVHGEIHFRYKSLMAVTQAPALMKKYYIDGWDGTAEPVTVESPKPGTPPAKDTVKSVSFTDLKDSEWAENYIYDLSGRGIIQGVGNKKFEPVEKVTRAAYIKMLMNALGYKSSSSYNTGYTDVPKNEWYYSFVATAQQAGVIPAGTGAFRPNDPITRKDMALYAYNALKQGDIQMPVADKVATYSDTGTLNDTEKNAITEFSKAGILSGFSDGTFKPNNNCTRAESTKVISVLISIIE